MNLPEGVVHQPNRERLCGKDEEYLIRVPDGYECREVDVQTGLNAYLDEGWAFYRLQLDPAKAAYATAWNGEFRIEVVPYDPKVFGARVDRLPSASPASPVDRIYEFQTFGMAAIDSGQGFLELWVAKAGDKVVVPARAYCVLFGLGETLIALELRCDPEPEPDPTWRDRVDQSGPPMLGYHTRNEVVFAMNPLWVNPYSPRFGIRLAAKPTIEKLRVCIPRSAGKALAPFLYRQLTRNLDVVGRFYSLGMQIHVASPEAILPQDPLRSERFPVPIYLSGPLKEEAASRSQVRSYLFGETVGRQEEVPAWQESFSVETQKRLRVAKKLMDLRPERRRPFAVVIEGTGEWTERCYRPAILTISQNASRKINVYYINDENWKKAPSWFGSLRARGEDGEVWLTEAYWNKANPGHRERYNCLKGVDAVFVVTPDVTHAEIAEHWLGKTPVVFVEKPFDTEAERFRGLLRAMALGEVAGNYKTAVVGIDHYLMRLTPLFGYLAPILATLGGLAGLSFEMTEEKSIERGREQTLSLGLGMDLLPHFVALLLLAGPLKSVDLIRVLRAIQYEPLDRAKFDNETGLAGGCHVTDYAGVRIGADFCAGKGIAPAFKRLRLRGTSGKDIFINFAENKVVSDGVPLGSPIWRTEASYEALMSDLFRGRNTILSTCLTVSDAEQIVRFLDEMWRATQWIKSTRGFDHVPIGTRVCPSAAGANA